MAVLACDVCGGKLVMGTGGVAVCDSCGMEHSKDRMQEKVQEIKGTVTVSNIAGIESLMKRGRLALEDNEWGKANGYFDKVLDIDPEYAPAYVGKLCVDISIAAHLSDYDKWGKNDLFAYTAKKEADLAHYYKPLDDEPDYQKAIRFADETYRAQLEGYNSKIKKRIAELKKDFSFYMIITYTHYQDGKNYLNPHDPNIVIEGRCLVGELEDGINTKILRTGSVYQVKKEKYPSTENYHFVIYCSKDSIKEGDVAAITHEMRKELEHEVQEWWLAKQRRWEEEEQEEKEQQKKAQVEQRHIEQSKQWKEQGLCQYCGGKLSLLGRKCKSCGKDN